MYMRLLSRTQKFNYQVRPARILSCKYSSLLHDLGQVKAKQCNGTGCPVNTQLQLVPSSDHDYTVTIMRLSDDLQARVNAVMDKGLIVHPQELIDLGLDSLAQIE